MKKKMNTLTRYIRELVITYNKELTTVKTLNERSFNTLTS